MSLLKIYCHPNCSTCKKALKLIQTITDKYSLENLLEKAPSEKELNIMLNNVDGNVRKMLNTSGELYREMGMKDKVPTMSNEEIIELLSKHGMLIKRPFIVYKTKGVVGYDEEAIIALANDYCNNKT